MYINLWIRFIIKSVLFFISCLISTILIIVCSELVLPWIKARSNRTKSNFYFLRIYQFRDWYCWYPVLIRDDRDNKLKFKFLTTIERKDRLILDGFDWVNISYIYRTKHE